MGGRSRAWMALAASLLLVLGGFWAAVATQRADGTTVTDVRFRAPDGAVLAGLLYRPAGAAAARPAPGVLAVHGYINTRETQSPFAIELARRGFVVLALDQRGHGRSGGAATRDGFGGPEGLAFLRSLPFVDRSRIGLEGHSMGGWTVLAAAAAMPDAYRAMVLEGSSTGAPYAREGTPAWPRNLHLVFSRFDEFAPLMWGAPRGADVGESPKMRALFGTPAPVVPGHLYGSVVAGTARLLAQPAVTHPGDHISKAAVGDALAWFDRTIGSPRPLPPADQIWWRKEAGTGAALAGLDLLAFALVALLAGPAPVRAAAAARPMDGGPSRADGRNRARLLLTALVPAVTFYLALLVAPPPLPPSRLFPQSVTNWLVVWALVNVGLALLIGRWLRAPAAAGGGLSAGRSVGIAAAVLAATYALVAAAGAMGPVDARFWVVALRPLSPGQWPAFLAYWPVFLLFVAVSFRGLRPLTDGRSTGSAMAVSAAALAGGFLLLTGAQYLWLFAAGALPVPIEALNAIVAIQFVPLLAALGALAAFSRARTGRDLAGVLIGGTFVAWYAVAGTATHVVG